MIPQWQIETLERYRDAVLALEALDDWREPTVNANNEEDMEYWMGRALARAGLVAEAELAEAQVAADLAAKEPKCCDRCGKKFDRSELHEYKCAEPGEWLRICKGCTP